MPTRTATAPRQQYLELRASVHRKLLNRLNLEALAADRAHEFLFIMTPLPLVGASGSPVAPIAIR